MRRHNTVNIMRVMKEYHLQSIIDIFKTQRKLMISLQNIKIDQRRGRMLA